MKKHPCEAFPHFIHGADYNPEQWIDDKSVWDKDMELMKLANWLKISRQLKNIIFGRLV